jgi:hypothetical protein|tara:strand:+ start:320 stop:517 length:198 start_codon:yes stop_codon:yes gene_type:complete
MIPILRVSMDYEIAEHSKKQEIWRQKQLDIFYRSGKPIFRVSPDNQHIKSNINPLYFKEKKPWES